MKVSILTDNYPGGNTGAEHGLSYFVEHEGTKILFDTGQSDLFLQNASKWGSISRKGSDHPESRSL